MERRKILIVEDEKTLLRAMVEKLEREGFETIGAENGELGLKVAEELQPDLILLDVLMPKMNGLETLKRIRQGSAWGKKVPIVMLTNLKANDKIMQQITENEPSYYFVKSDWQIKDVVQKVQEILD